MKKREEHGGSKEPVYKVWHAMIERCRNPNQQEYPQYGGRGIAVCARWDNYSAFRADMGPRPVGGTLERIDVNGNYEPSNCRWASQREQGNNRRNNRRITFNGETMTMADWARRIGVSKRCLEYRMNAGWPISHALTYVADRRVQHRR